MKINENSKEQDENELRNTILNYGIRIPQKK
jgi:hypothetical protein